ncbi:MAG: nitroreductase family protein [Deltaproteobacteria bacterium]|nr:nitroreductase family protein [Deltaproteobacteria bacterium]
MDVINESLSPLGTYKEGMPWNPVEKVIMERRSVRRFKKEPLPDNLIRRILEAARFAPSAGNGQPWKFLVIKSPEIIAEMERDATRITKFFMFFYGYTMYWGLRRLITKIMATWSVLRLYSNEFSAPPFFAMTQAAEDQTVYYQGAPVVIIILEDKRGVSNPTIDTGVAGENIVLAAHSLGVGACWMGFTRLLTYYPKWRKKFGLGKYPYRFGNSICLGYPAANVNHEVPREVQLVEWYEGGMKDSPRIDRQGE